MGDRVAVRFWTENYGALGEYAIVNTAVADKVPDSISSDEAAALISASPATVVAERIKPGERVLVLGGSLQSCGPHSIRAGNWCWNLCSAVAACPGMDRSAVRFV